PLQPRQYLGRLRLDQRDLGNVGLEPCARPSNRKFPGGVLRRQRELYGSERGVPARGPAGPEPSAQRARAVLDSVFERSGPGSRQENASEKTHPFRKVIRAALTSSGRSC